MFEPKTLKVLSIIAIVICVIAGILSLILALIESGMAYLSVLSWAFLAYSSYCAMKLTGYDIYDEDLRGLGWSIYILFGVFILFIFVGVSVGPIVAIAVAGKLHFQKNTHEEWLKNNS